MSAPAAQEMLVIVVDGQPYIEYDRRKPLAGRQREGLERMDRQMDQGIRLGGDWLDRPDRVQRAQFVAGHLIEALQDGNDALIAASCAWLATRLPDLKQVVASLTGGAVSFELVFDRPWAPEVAVDFTPRPDGN